MCAVQWMELGEISEGEVGLESVAHVFRAVASNHFGAQDSF